MDDRLIIYIDMDGVLSDFVGQCAVIFGQDIEDVYSGLYKKESYDVCKGLNITTKELWKTIDAHGHAFWANMRPTPDGQEIWNMLHEESEDCFVCTSPALDPSSYSGKRSWMIDFVGSNWYNKMILTKHKHLLAGPRRVLVDDSDDNIDRFIEAGGHGILVPRPWNSQRLNPMKPVAYIRQEIQKLTQLVA